MADIVVIDDEADLAYSIGLALKRSGHECRIAETGADGLAECARKTPDLVLVDMQLPDRNGLDLVQKLSEPDPDLPIVMITAHGTVSHAVDAMKRGAADFLQKPLSMEEVCLCVQRCLENRRIRNELDAYKQAQQRAAGTIRIVGESPAMQRVLETAQRIAAIPRTAGEPLFATLLLGETGTGKEVIARHIHGLSSNAERPFVHVNCTAIPENLFESELFGHERGTFTDAKQGKRGLLEIADGGTILLDEIGDVPVSIQAKLLVAIETGRFRRLGGTSERTVDVAVMAATNSDLEAKIERGEFRKDLYFRLKTFAIDLPPLRDRGDDLFLLTDYFLDMFCRKYHKPPPLLPEETRTAMKRYAWPGNVRELVNALRSAVLIDDSGAITPKSLGIDRTAVPLPASTAAGVVIDVSREDCTLASVEKEAILAALDAAGGNTSLAARMLGLSRGGLRHRLDKYGIESGKSPSMPTTRRSDQEGDGRTGADGRGL